MLWGCGRTLSLIYDLDVYDPTPFFQPSFGMLQGKTCRKERTTTNQGKPAMEKKKKVSKG